MHIARHVLLLALAWLGLAWWAPARADTENCTAITSVPILITTPGHYCLRQDFTAAFSGTTVIDIIADNTVIDCNGHVLRATDNANFSTAILGDGNRRNVTVRNCVVDNFYTGIFVMGVNDPLSLGIRVQDNTVLHSRATAIGVIGSANRIERNKISQTTANEAGGATGIMVYSAEGVGTGNVIRDNQVTDWKPTPPGAGQAIYGIRIFNLTNTEIVGNTVSGVYANTNAGVSGIYGDNASYGTATDNVVLSGPLLPAPLDGANYSGIVFTGAQAATNLCRGNTVGHFAINYSGCTQVGNTGF
jgi:hypothetical protein